MSTSTLKTTRKEVTPPTLISIAIPLLGIVLIGCAIGWLVGLESMMLSDRHGGRDYLGFKLVYHDLVALDSAESVQVEFSSYGKFTVLGSGEIPDPEKFPIPRATSLDDQRYVWLLDVSLAPGNYKVVSEEGHEVHLEMEGVGPLEVTTHRSSRFLIFGLMYSAVGLVMGLIPGLVIGVVVSLLINDRKQKAYDRHQAAEREEKDREFRKKWGHFLGEEDSQQEGEDEEELDYT